MAISNKLRPEQIEVSTGTTDNDTVTTKGYVDDRDFFLRNGTSITTKTAGDDIITDGAVGGFIGNIDDSTDSSLNISVNTSALTIAHITYDPAFPGSSTVGSGVAWQSFTPTADIWCPGIAPGIKISGQVGTLWIYSGEGVGGTLLLTMTGVSMPTPNTFNDITFPRMLFFENGQKYTWAWERDSGGYSFEQKDGYAGGTNDTGIDYLFKIYEATVVSFKVDKTTGNIHTDGAATIGSGTDGYIDVLDSSDVSQAKLNSVGDGYHMQNFGLGTKTPNTKLDVQGGQTVGVREVNSATDTLLITDYILHVTYTTTGPVTSFTLPTAQAVAGRTIHIVDAGNNAGTNNITINVEGGGSFDINSNGNSYSFYTFSSNWFIY